VSGHLWQGRPGPTSKNSGDIIDERQSALVIAGKASLNKAELKAGKRAARELNASAKDLGKAVQETEGRQLTRRTPTCTVAPDHPI